MSDAARSLIVRKSSLVAAAFRSLPISKAFSKAPDIMRRQR